MTYTLHQYCSGDKIEKNMMGGALARMRRVEIYTGFWWGNLREKAHLDDPGVDGRIILRWLYWKWVGAAWTGLIWLRIGTGSGHL
jgi:hypothetical protein